MSPFDDLHKSHPNERLFDQPPLMMDAEGLAQDFKRYLGHTFGRDRDCRSTYYPYKALAIVMRDRLMERWKRTRHAHDEADCKRTYYLSLEVLMGRAMSNAMLNLGIENAAEQALFDLGLLLEELSTTEPDAGLGNGGLGRLAACFLDSCATLGLRPPICATRSWARCTRPSPAASSSWPSRSRRWGPRSLRSPRSPRS